MSEHNSNPNTLDQLRDHDGPTIDTLDVVTAATTAGRRRVRRRQGVATLAAAVLVGSMGTGWALTSSGDERAEQTLVAAEGQDADGGTGELADSVEENALLREPLRGSQHHQIVAALTDRQVVSVTPDPAKFTAYDPDTSPANDYWLQEPRSSNFKIDGYLAIVQFTWGSGDGFTPAEAELFNSMRTVDAREAPAVAADFGTTPIEHCRSLHGENTTSPGTCSEAADGTAYGVSDFADAGQVRSVHAYHPDGWVQTIDIHSFTGHSAGNVDLGTAHMPTTDELLTFVREGVWFE